MGTIYDAVKGGNLEEVMRMVERDPQIVMTRLGHEAFHRACYEGHVDIVEFLMDHGAQQDWFDFMGRRALHLASSEGQEAVVRLLLDRQADNAILDTRTTYG